ncbi:hypothetical protein Pmani_017504 [Petrolisthes manimaculis]|uniref:Uncharacterized protein n=1 Tax=Petrolisthes manimaculis TaxID=1843537 RepID=A0AAE1PMH4_9EUCA|nr:hypothetical protein Pmani_017504 [Petrolisthes manimaculis]
MDTTLHQIREQQQQQVLKLAHNFSLGSPRILGSTGKGGSGSVRVRWDEVGRVVQRKERKGWSRVGQGGVGLCRERKGKEGAG